MFDGYLNHGDITDRHLLDGDCVFDGAVMFEGDLKYDDVTGRHVLDS